MKRLVSFLLALILLAGAVPLTGWLTDAPLVSQAAAADLGELEYALFPMEIMDISRSNNKAIGYRHHTDGGSHDKYYSYDYVGADTTVNAPFSMRVIAMGGSHSVVFESMNKVRLANGMVDYLTCMYTHDNNVSDIKKGYEYTQGEYFYDQGTYPNFDKHLHMEIALGNGYFSDGKFNDANLEKFRKNGIQAYDALFVKTTVKKGKDDTNIVDGNGYPWKRIQEVDFHVGNTTIKRYYPVDEAYGSLPSPIESGKRFKGWSTDTKGENLVTSTMKPAIAHRHLYAQWEAGGGQLKSEWMAVSSLDMPQGRMIGGVVKVPMTAEEKTIGYYIGADKNFLSKSSAVYTTKNRLPVAGTAFNLRHAGITLQPDTTYYYRLYVRIGEKESLSEIKSFTTAKAAEPAKPALNVRWSGVKASNITQTNATIAGKATYGKTVTPTECGFYLGTAQNSLTKATKNDKINAKREYSNMSFGLNKYGQTLKAGTTYYCKLYVIVDGKEYTSSVFSFTTKGDTSGAPAPEELNIAWSDFGASGISQTNATVKVKATYGKTVSPERCGFYIGTAEDALTKAAKFDTISGTRTYSGMSYDMNKYGQTLNAGTTYYVRFYVVVDGAEYQSKTYSFTTAAAQAKPEQTPLSPKWSEYEISGIAADDATLKAKVTYGKTVYPEKCGFYIGLSQEQLTKAEKFDTVSGSRTYSGLTYNMKKYGQTLKAGTTYYYQFYVVVDGVEYKSDIKSFTTAAAWSPAWSDYGVSGISKTDATIKVKATYGKTVYPEKCGFYIGTAQNALGKCAKFDTISGSRTYSNMSYNMKKYGQTLKAGTTYYYQFYVVLDGVEYKSDIKSFTTKK